MIPLRCHPGRAVCSLPALCAGEQVCWLQQGGAPGEQEEGSAHPGHPSQLQARQSLLPCPQLPLPLWMPWKADPERPNPAAITACCAFHLVTLLCDPVLALHSFGTVCVRIFRVHPVLLVPATGAAELEQK